MKKANPIKIIIIILIGLIIVAIPDLYNWNYWYKSIIKVIILLIIPLLYLYLNKIPLSLFKINSKTFLNTIGLSILIITFIISGYFLLRNIIDFSPITQQLNDIGINSQNFIFIAIYIALINSLIEEFFFEDLSLINSKLL